MNRLSTPERYHGTGLPPIDDLLHTAKHTPFISTIDLHSGYHQISSIKRGRNKTVFVTPFGTFRYLRMPLVLRNGPATFQRLIDQFRRGVNNILFLGYLGDLSMHSPTLDQYLEA